MISPALFDEIVQRLRAAGFADKDIEWAESIQPPATPDEFAFEAIFVICNSGMQNMVARGIFDRVCSALENGHPAISAFRHPGKVAAIQQIWEARAQLHAAYLAADDKLAFCAGLPYIGKITKFHLAKNFGADVVKPDVHLQRLADVLGTTPTQLCTQLAQATGYRVATIDTLVWRACANGILDSHTGQLVPERG